MDDGVAAMLSLLDAGFPAVETMTGAQARAAVAARRVPVANLDDVDSTTDTVVPGGARPIAVRIYRPHGAGAGPLPAVVFCHGGGFVLCDLDSHDSFCRAMSRYTRSVVVSVAYRLAPEHRAPAAVQDTIAAFQWVVAHAEDLAIDPTRVAVAGDSAGGNLAAVTALWCRERDAPAPVAQVLLYPALDPSCDTPSQHANGVGQVTTRAAMQWYWRQYLDGDLLTDPAWLVAPASADSHAGLAPALILTAGLDPLHSEGVAYARLLRDSGVPVVHRDFPGLFHGFLTMMSFAPAASARELIWADIRELLAPVREPAA